MVDDAVIKQQIFMQYLQPILDKPPNVTVVATSTIVTLVLKRHIAFGNKSECSFNEREVDSEPLARQGQETATPLKYQV